MACVPLTKPFVGGTQVCLRVEAPKELVSGSPEAGENTAKVLEMPPSDEEKRYC